MLLVDELGGRADEHEPLVADAELAGVGLGDGVRVAGRLALGEDQAAVARLADRRRPGWPARRPAGRRPGGTWSGRSSARESVRFGHSDARADGRLRTSPNSYRSRHWHRVGMGDRSVAAPSTSRGSQALWIGNHHRSVMHLIVVEMAENRPPPRGLEEAPATGDLRRADRLR